MRNRIPSSVTIRSCEQALLELRRAPREFDHLVAPTNFRHSSFGAEISWVQFILTWAHRYKNCRLSTYAEDPKDLQIEKFTTQLIGIVASLCASEIRSQRNNTVLTDSYKGQAIDRLDLLQEPRPNEYMKGQKIVVIANDDRGRDTPASLYPRMENGRRKIGSLPYFVRAASRLIKAILPNEREITSDADTDSAFGHLLYETYRNTEDHAKYDIVGNHIQHSYRIMQASFTSGTKERLTEATDGIKPLQQYINRFQTTHGRSQLTFLSLSVLDSGPGFAQSFTLLPLGELEFDHEMEVTLKCFTSATRQNRPELGKGLQLVREYLRRRRGFLRLRTGRVSLYYDGNTDTNSDDLMPFTSWVANGQQQAAPVEGSLVTMHLPVGGTC